MKKGIFLGFLLFIIASCSQLEELHLLGNKNDNEVDDLPCPIVSGDNIPGPVANTFTRLYPNITPRIWCVTNSLEYVAVFLLNSLETKVFMDKNGSFLKEEIETDQKGDHQDEESGCECALTEDAEDED